MSKLSGRNAGAWRILCIKCGKLKPQHLFDYAKNERICKDCAEENVEVTVDLLRHVQTIFNLKRN
jgi:rRNA maturation endonuclease Nob1